MRLLQRGMWGPNRYSLAYE